MGICADIVRVKPANSFDKNAKPINYYTGGKKIQEHLKEKYGDYIIIKDIFYLGGGEVFKKGILDTYKNDEGFIPFEDGWKFVKPFIKEEIVKEANRKFHIKRSQFKHFFHSNNGYYIDLGY